MTTASYRFQIGDFHCLAINDGDVVGNSDFLFANAPPETLAQSLLRLGLEPEHIPSTWTCLLVRTPRGRCGHLFSWDDLRGFNLPDKNPQSSNGRTLTFPFPALKIGTACYDDPTGCTIFLFPERVLATCDVRGGTPGVSEYQYSRYDAICFAGGSLRGLEVVGGVRAAMMAEYGVDRDLVSGAVVNDGFNPLHPPNNSATNPRVDASGSTPNSSSSRATRR